MQLHWHTEPLLLITLLLFGWLYAIAIGPLRSAIDPNARFSLSRGISFYLGLIITYLAVGSPLDQIGEQFLFSAHMIQHMLLIYITPTLFFVGIPNWLIDLNHIYYPDADPVPFSPDPFYDEFQWNLRQIKAKEALDLIGQETKDIVVAVLDSGSPTSDSLAFENSSFVSGGYDFVSNTDASFDGDGLDLSLIHI